ncbi:MAG: peroxiredoxin [Planctomycetota bacterium]
MLRYLFSELFQKGKRAMLKIGDTAPAFEATDHTGKKIKLADFAGKRIVLWFYPKADTPGCTKEACGFRDNTPAYQGKDVEILGVSFDTPAENKAFADKFKLKYRLLSDTDRKIGIAYKAADNASDKYAKRYTYVIGATGKIEQAIDTKDPANQAADLLKSV